MTSQEETSTLCELSTPTREKGPWSDDYRSANEGQDIINFNTFGSRILLISILITHNSLVFLLVMLP